MVSLLLHCLEIWRWGYLFHVSSTYFYNYRSPHELLFQRIITEMWSYVRQHWFNVLYFQGKLKLVFLWNLLHGLLLTYMSSIWHIHLEDLSSDAKNTYLYPHIILSTCVKYLYSYENIPDRSFLEVESHFFPLEKVVSPLSGSWSLTNILPVF